VQHPTRAEQLIVIHADAGRSSHIGPADPVQDLHGGGDKSMAMGETGGKYVAIDPRHRGLLAVQEGLGRQWCE